MRNVTYFSPSAVDEAVNLLAENEGAISILSGGTDLVPKINSFQLKGDGLLYVGKLGLDFITERGDQVVIGSATTTAALAANDIINQKVGVLAEAARLSGCRATRTTATIGGNLGNASPAADMVPPLMVMDAKLLLKGSKGERSVLVKDFFQGPGETVLQPDELILEIIIPLLEGNTAFFKLGKRKALTLSVVNVAVRIDMAGETCKEARIAMGSMAPTPIRCTGAEEMLKEKYLNAEVIRAAAAQAVEESNPIDDQRASAWYRRKAGAALVAKALGQAAGIEINKQ